MVTFFNSIRRYIDENISGNYNIDSIAIDVLLLITSEKYQINILLSMHFSKCRF